MTNEEELRRHVYETLEQGVPEVRVRRDGPHPDDLRALTDALVTGWYDALGTPSREDLIMGLMLAQDAYDRGEVHPDTSRLEHLVDTVVLPLLRVVRPVSNRVTGTVTGNVIQANHIEGGVRW